MKEELISALDELRKYKHKYRHLKSFIVEQKEKHEQKNKEMEKIMSNLKDKIMEASKIRKFWKNLLKKNK